MIHTYTKFFSQTSLRSQRNSLVPLVLFSNGFELGLPKQNSNFLKTLSGEAIMFGQRLAVLNYFLKIYLAIFSGRQTPFKKREEKVIRKTIQGLVHTQSHSDQKYRYLACVGDSRVYMFTTQNGPFLKMSQITQKLNAAKGNALQLTLLSLTTVRKSLSSNEIILLNKFTATLHYVFNIIVRCLRN